jgi:glucose-1-phosphate adenylyltransferase
MVEERPDIVNCGISIVGKRAVVPTGMTVGRNVIIGPGVAEELEGMDAIESGETVLPEQMPLHLFV